MILRAGLVWLALATQAGAVELSLPQSARQTVVRNTAPDSYMAPTTVFKAGAFDTVSVEGRVARSAWRLEAPGLTPLQLLAPLRSQLKEAGYQVVLDCNAISCGGFDFRFAVETLPGPNMYVNIRAYQYITAIKGPLGAPTDIATVLASTSTSSAYVQIIQATASAAQSVPDANVQSPSVVVGDGGLGAALLGQGHAVLSGLDFSSGTAALSDSSIGALAGLAAFLTDQPDIRIVLVGHTDSDGALDPNIALSRSRAVAVRERLLEKYDIAPNRVEAQGMGYLSPVASNLTPEGREANRRVEAVVISRD